MCGIYGVLNFTRQPITEQLMREMGDMLRHRGPDGSGIHISQHEAQVGLGHRRLAVIDLSERAQQPMSNEDGSLWLVCNGEIYNFKSLSQRLKSRGHIFKSDSDSEIIIHLYEEMEENCIQELDGMFAFAIWDSPKRRLFLARDRVGKKPLYYYLDDKLFAFASEIKALLKHPKIKGELNLRAFPLYLSYGYVPTPETFYKNIHKFPPASYAIINSRGKLEIREYWDLDFGKLLTGFSEEECARRVRELVFEAVRKRLISDVSLGAFLSGGIDSSIVVGIMSQLMKEKVKTFSIGFSGDSSFDETKYSRLVAERFNTNHTEFIVKPDAFELMDKLIYYYDEPYGDSSAIPTYIVSKLTREHVTVALNGDGGDELFAGYFKFWAGMVTERIPDFLKKISLKFMKLLPEPQNYRNPLRRGKRFLEAGMLPLPERLLRWRSFFFGESLKHLLRQEFSEVLNESELSRSFSENLSRSSRWSTLSQLLYLNIKTNLLDDLLPKMDRMTMANSLEGRSPFLDKDLIEYVCTLPDSMKLRRRRTKYILKKAFQDILPDEVQKRGKMGFSVPLDAWFRGDLKDYVIDILLSPTTRVREFLKEDRVQEIIKTHQAGIRDLGPQLWSILNLELWLRRQFT